MSNTFLEIIKKRRSVYSLGKEVSLPNETVVAIVEDAITHSPSAFGAQPTRVVVLFNQHHDKVWNFVEDQLKQLTSAEQFVQTKAKIDSFRAAYGTILFFEDQETIQTMQKKLRPLC